MQNVWLSLIQLSESLMQVVWYLAGHSSTPAAHPTNKGCTVKKIVMYVTMLRYENALLKQHVFKLIQRPHITTLFINPQRTRWRLYTAENTS